MGRCDFRLKIAAVAVLGATTLTSCAEDAGGTGAGGVPLVAKDKLTVCVHTPHPPFHAKDSSGQVIGFDIDMMGLVAEKLGVAVSPVERAPEGIESGQDLDTGKCDLAAGLTVNGKRRSAMDLSEPYFDNAQVLAIRQSDVQLIKDTEALRGRKLSVQGDTSGARYAHKVKKEKGFKVLEYPDFSLQQKALCGKEVDGSIGELSMWTEFNRRNPNQVAIIEQFGMSEKYAYAARKDADPRLLQAVNDALWEARNSGKYGTIYAKWLGPGQ